MTKFTGLSISACLFFLLLPSSFVQSTEDRGALESAGEFYYIMYCTQCHDGSVGEAPTLKSLNLYPTEKIVSALESGVMQAQGASLSDQQKLALATYLSRTELPAESDANLCSAGTKSELHLSSRPHWAGWGARSRLL